MGGPDPAARTARAPTFAAVAVDFARHAR